jgi:hypothetical protein
MMCRRELKRRGGDYTAYFEERLSLLGDILKRFDPSHGSRHPVLVPSYKMRVVNELIKRGVYLRNEIHEGSDSLQIAHIGELTEEWARECWERLGEAVGGLRGLFHMQTHGGLTAPEIIGYLDMRLGELRNILGRLS